MERSKHPPCVKQCNACSHVFADRGSTDFCPQCGDSGINILSEEQTLSSALSKARALRSE